MSRPRIEVKAEGRARRRLGRAPTGSENLAESERSVRSAAGESVGMGSDGNSRLRPTEWAGVYGFERSLVSEGSVSSSVGSSGTIHGVQNPMHCFG